MRYRALIPVKVLHEAKSRLTTYLTPAQRAQLVLDMLQHVLLVLHNSQAFERISVVSADPRVLQQAQAWGAIARPEEAAGHNPALHAAALHELAAGTGTNTALLTISADLPFLRTADIRDLLAQSEQHQVVLARSQEGSGTNALLVRPPLAVPYVFGVESLQRYIVEAQQRQLAYTVYDSFGLAHDIDTYNDLSMIHCPGMACTGAPAS